MFILQCTRCICSCVNRQYHDHQGYVPLARVKRLILLLMSCTLCNGTTFFDPVKLFLLILIISRQRSWDQLFTHEQIHLVYWKIISAEMVLKWASGNICQCEGCWGSVEGHSPPFLVIFKIHFRKNNVQVLVRLSLTLAQIAQ